MAQQVFEHLDQITPATPVADDLPHRLATIRTACVATSRGELVPGAVAIAVPVLAGDQCACSLALAAPERRADARWQRHAKELLEIARHDIEALV